MGSRDQKADKIHVKELSNLGETLMKEMEKDTEEHAIPYTPVTTTELPMEWVGMPIVHWGGHYQQYKFTNTCPVDLFLMVTACHLKSHPNSLFYFQEHISF